MSRGWVCGAAQVPFPVPAGTPMEGYAARPGPALGTLDELTIGALSLEAGDGRLVLVAVDLAAVDSALVDEVAAAAGVHRSELVLCASHTHSGPAGVISRLHPSEPDSLNPALRGAFIRAAVKAIASARSRAEPVELLFGRAETSGLAANRNRADGPCDPHVSILATRNRAGRLTSLLAHFACHPTILSAENRLVSADFPGAFRRALEPMLSEDALAPVVLFVNGAAGDVSTRFTRLSQDSDEVERVGAGLANAARSALEIARPLDPVLAFAQKAAALRPRGLEHLPAAPSGVVAHGQDSAATRRIAETRAQGAMLLERLAQAGPDAIQRTCAIPAWRLGDLRIVAIPGELFASLGERIVRSSPDPVLVFGYANGYVGYLVDEAADAAGTYEALASPFAPGAGDELAGVALAALNALASEAEL
ncbi:MAG: neutral/alkaline non-lysosomal ceramidase N-terminal domain-containing protein [Thermomicrobiales bacterium]